VTAREAVAAARSLLFVPGHRPDRFDRAAGSGADLVVIDLEDAVAAERKAEARENVRRRLADGHDAVVRINAVGTAEHEADAELVAAAGCAVMLPKAESADDIAALAARLAEDVPIIPLIETAAGVANAVAVCGAPGVVRPAFGSVDLAAQLGVDHHSHEALRHARSTLVIAAATARRAAPIDGVTTEIDDESALDADLAHAATLGFTAKLCIHPRQVAAVNERFLPDAEETAWARAVLRAAGDGSVTVYNGQMIDRPVLLRARAVLARAGEREG
jgi:citrate lyase subunit beta/citryl-CoA lyase